MDDVVRIYSDSCVYADEEKTVLVGHMAIKPNGNVVQLPSGSVSPAASPSGYYIAGLKDGFRLVSAADVTGKASLPKARPNRAKAPPVVIEKTE